MLTNLPKIDIDVKTLPSKSISYPLMTAIKYRPFTYGELKELSQSKLSISDRIEFILRGIEGNFDKYQMTLNDFIFIGLLRRLSSISTNSFSIEYICDSCGKKNKFNFDISKLEFYDVEIPEVPINVTIKGKKLKFSFLTVQNYIDLYNKGKHTDNIAALAMMCKNVEFDEIYDLLYNLTDSEDCKCIEEIDKMLAHGVKPLKTICSNKSCKHKAQINIDSEEGSYLILPFREQEINIRERFTFGNK